ncbi:MAG: hypothetical protein Q8K62_00550 [Thiobacillus sp.]|nr:hypothetical protein [Thiobacillus sp.]
MKPVLNVLLTLTMVAATAAFAGQQTMPPSFSGQNEPETVLRAYPLGITTKQAAFSHHGKALRTLILPNGKEGWVYEVGGKQAQTYQHPTREKHTVYEAGPSNGVRTYTLVFDDRGVVIDVLYNEKGRHDGLTALQVQRKVRGEGARKGEGLGVK